MPTDDKQTESDLNADIQRAVESALEESADVLLQELKRTAPDMLAEHRAIQAGFEARLRERWGKALDLFETILVIAQEAGETFGKQHAERAAQDNDHVFWVLVRLHARACQTASEVMALLSSGFATAAMSRWRTIHEIAVVMSLIRDYGKELAERYLAHEAIEATKGAEEYQTYHVRLGHEMPYRPEEIAELRAHCNGLLNRYGRNFRNQYGWASEALAIAQPTFYQLEQAAHLDHMRPYYRMASHEVHGNPKGIVFQLGRIGDERRFLAGASNAGLADPGHATLISLVQCTVSFLNLHPDVSVALTDKALLQLVDEAGDEFLRIHEELLRDEERIRRAENDEGD